MSFGRSLGTCGSLAIVQVRVLFLIGLEAFGVVLIGTKGIFSAIFQHEEAILAFVFFIYVI